MDASFEYIPDPKEPWSDRDVDVIRGQYHKFMLIPLMQHYTTWFDAGPVAIGVEARALGETRDHMIRGPSIHLCSADHRREFVRFDVFGSVLHYHYILNASDHNILWGYDPDVNGPMIPWAITALRDRMATLLRAVGEDTLTVQVAQSGWDSSVLPEVEKACYRALEPRDDELAMAREGMAWMRQWKTVHPQFNTVESGEC